MLKIGAFADLHYAEDKRYGTRYCDLSLKKLERLAEVFNEEKVDIAVCLGDIIDSSGNEEEDIISLNKVLVSFAAFNAPLHIVLGNHDLEAMSKDTFFDTLGLEDRSRYYSFDMDNTLFIVLDANNTINTQYNSGNFEWTQSYVDAEQAVWLKQTLIGSKAKMVVTFIHQNLDGRHNKGVPDPHVVINSSEIRAILENSGKDITVLQGHDHKGYDQTLNGIRYLTLPAVVEDKDLQRIPHAIINTKEKMFRLSQLKVYIDILILGVGH